MGEARPTGVTGQPSEFKLDGTRLMLALQEAGMDLKKLDLKYLLQDAAHGFEIQEVESRLESARAADWRVTVSVIVEY